ncbi:MAG: hypothetical protein LC797_23360 [Chloroflexi bacterium]|nr:hypothetical protein [Chloroflexota bacterium]
MNGAALAMVALGSATQVAFYLRDFGATHRTDGFIVAFAVYSLVVVVAQILRTTAVPLLSGPKPVLTGPSFGWAVVLVAAVTAGACEALAVPLAHVIAGASGSEGRRIATSSLRVMAPAMGLQVIGAGLAVAGALRGRLASVALAYMASAAAGLAAFFPLRGPTSEIVLAWTMLVASLVLVVGLLLGSRIQSRLPPVWRAVPRAAFALLWSTPLPASFVVMYPITLALAAGAGARPGQITLFGLAFTACSYLAGFTSQALSMVDAVALAHIDPGAADERRALVTRAFRYSLLIAALGLGVAAVAGGPIVRALLPHYSAGAHTYFGTDLVLLIPYLVATLGLWATLPQLLARDDRLVERRLAVAVLALLALHIGATLVGRAVAGFHGVILGMAAAPATFVTVGLRIAAPSAGRELVRDTVIVAAVAGASFGAFDLGAWALGVGGPAAGVAAALAGGLVYLAVIGIAYPDARRTARLLGARGSTLRKAAKSAEGN